MNKKNKIMAVILISIGAALFLSGVLGVVDSYWSGMGGGVLGVGSVRLVRVIRYHKDEAYRENADVQAKDERNVFLAGKAWSWAGSLYVILTGIAVVVLKIAGYGELSTWAAYSVCLMILLYWLSYLWLRKKY